MRWDAMAQELRAAFRKGAPAVGGCVRIPREPVDLDKLVAGFADTEEDRDDVELDGTLGVLRKQWTTTLILDFEWQSFGPMSSDEQLFTLLVGSREVYACIDSEVCGLLAVAALDETNDPRFWPRFLTDLLANNGQEYHCNVFGSLPTMTRNAVPHLLPKSAVREAYSRWMDWANSEGFQTWAELEKSLSLQARERDPLKASEVAIRETLAGFPGGQDVAALKEWYDRWEERRRRPYTAVQKELVLDCYFSMCYRE